ncbi:hypothetical protein AwEntero_22650 [Enterobacterales bacterium]|nr:hypothetical protein AwEntero_22650 [Enterobacterales bacterium]
MDKLTLALNGIRIGTLEKASGGEMSFVYHETCRCLIASHNNVMPPERQHHVVGRYLAAEI